MASADEQQVTSKEPHPAPRKEEERALNEDELKGVAGGVLATPEIKPIRTRSGIVMELVDSSPGSTPTDSTARITTQSGIVMEFDG